MAVSPRTPLKISTLAALAALAGCDRQATAKTRAAMPAATAATGPKIDFNRQVRPLLSDRCFGCHGPDAGKGRKGGLRLDTPEGARALLKSGHRALVPGHTDQSEMARRIASEDPEVMMPPPELNRPLSAAEKDLLTRWVAQGGEYRPHWAFAPPKPAPAPKVAQAGWVRDPLDAFILAGIEDAKLAPAPESDRATWLRRASMVLTGLPPTPEETDAFVADTAPDAFEKRADAMLASPRAAEHRAVAWMDLARYADSYGFSGDPDMHAWPWRDWVLQSFDKNLPFDRFAVEQIAGDLLPEATQDQKLATAFNRLHRATFEGGSISEEFRQEGIADRVQTFGYAFLGLTMECAKCHDHKYDPIAQKDFFAMAAMFSDIGENGLLPYSQAAPVPALRLANPAQEKRRQELADAVKAAETAHAASLARAAQAAEKATVGGVSVPAPAAHYPLDTLAGGGTPNTVAGGQPATTERHRGDQLGRLAATPGKVGGALAFDGDGGLFLAGFHGFDAFSPFSFSTWIKAGERNGRAALLHAAGFYTNDADASGLDLMIDQGRVQWACIEQWPGSAVAIRTKAELPVGRWVQLTATYDGLGRADGLHLYLDGQPADCDTLHDHLTGPVRTSTLELGSRSRDSGFRNGTLDEVKLWRTALTPAEAAVEAGKQPDPAALKRHALERMDTDLAQAREKLRQARRAAVAHEAALPAVPCMEHAQKIRPSFVLTRGAYDHPDLTQPVSPGVVPAVKPFDPQLPKDRLGLARWLTAPDHPLLARVEVNRLWAQVFGRGLVPSTENFGLQGDPPSHPELLDQLACDFIQGGWNERALLRRLVLSATFRQGSANAPGKLAADPQNLLLARGPVQRLSAEMLRDQALLASGLLVEKFGGPSVKPWQPPGLWGDAGLPGGEYHPDRGDNAHRRSLYTYRKRTAPPPNQMLFDAGSREVCQPRRLSTNTPLQALALLNDPVYTECAKALAARAAREAGADPAARATRAFRLLCTRAPRPAELAALTELLATQQAAMQADPAAAKAVCGAEDPALAALTLACSALLAGDAAVSLR